MKARKLTVLAAGMVMAMSLMACGGTAGSTNNTGAAVGAADENVQIPNPFVDCESLEKACEVAGFKMEAPESVEGFGAAQYMAIENDFIHIWFEKGDSDVCIRKGVHTDGGDISGDYNEYAEEKQVTVGGYSVTMKGNDGKISVAIWSSGDYDYCVGCTEGLSQEQVESLIAEVK